MAADRRARGPVAPKIVRSFLVGCPRSGTTLLQAFLAAHPGVRSFPESHVFQFAHEPGGAARRARRTREAVARFADAVGRNGDAVVRWIPPVFPGPYVTRFVRLLDELAVGTGRRVWVEKTPDHVLYIPEIMGRVRDARFIHLVRDGRAVVASLHEVTRRHPEVWGSAWTLENCVEHWNRCLRATIRALQADGRHIVLRYEDLVAGPRSALERVGRFLGLEFREEMLTDYAAAVDPLVTGEERAWKEEAFGALSDPGLSKYERAFSPDERRRIEAGLDPVSESLFA